MAESSRCSLCGAPLPAEAASAKCDQCLAALPATLTEGAINPGDSLGSTDPNLLSRAIQKMEAVPQGLGDFEFLNQGNQGGMGVVYRARQISLNRIVALKMIRSGGLASGRDVERFRREAEAAASLDHPHIVPIYEVGEEQGRQYFTMKWIDGRGIAEEFGSSPTITREGRIRIVHLTLKVARAVQHAHERGILHRDLKPANILIDSKGEPHVTDFGLAKRLDGGVELTVSGAVMGTPSYMPPEQAEGNTKATTIASDIYSLGAVLYRLLTGRAPFVGQSTFDIIRQVLVKEPPRPASLSPGLDRDLEAVCLKCLEKKPQQRYASAAALADDLENWLAGKPIAARPVSNLRRTGKWVRRHAAVSALAAAVILSVVIGLAAVLWQSQRAERQRAITAAATIARRLQRAQDFFETDKSHLALATLARILRDNPGERVAAERLVNILDQRVFLAPVTVSVPANFGPPDQSRHGTRLVRRVDGESFRFEDLESGTSVSAPIQAHGGPIRKISFSSDGRRFVTASADRTARVWDGRTGVLLLTLTNSGPVLWAEFSPDGQRIVTATGAPDYAAHLWDATTGIQGPTPMRHLDKVNSACFSPDGKLIVTASDDQTIRLWNGESGAPAGEPAHLSSQVDEARFSDDGLYVISTNSETAENWTFALTHGLVFSEAAASEVPIGTKLSAPLERYKWLLARQHSGEITCVDLNSARDVVATASSDKSARLWDARTLQPMGEPLVHDATVNCVRFSADGLRVVTSTAQPTEVRVWDVRTTEPLTDWIHSRDPISAVRFSADDQWIISDAGWKIEVHLSSGKAPIWLAELAEGIAGVRYTQEGILQPVSREALPQMEQELLELAPTSPLAVWARGLTKPNPLQDKSQF